MKNQHRTVSCDCGSTDVRPIGKDSGVFQCRTCGEYFDDVAPVRPQPRRMKRDFDDE